MRNRAVTIVAAVCVASLLIGGAAFASASPAQRSSQAMTKYTVTKLVSDQAGEAAFTDKHLVNAWGLSASSTSPWWVANNGSDTSTLYMGDGSPQSLVVRVYGAPTGTVFNGGTGFVVKHKGSSGPSIFLFDTENGKILGWNPNVPPPSPSRMAWVILNRAKQNAIYKGLAIASTDSGDYLYAADFHNARVDVVDENNELVPGGFEDPNLPDGYAPFGIQTIGESVFVAYAKQDADGEDEEAGPGLGIVDEYDTAGNLVRRVASHGPLDAPWGMAMAPADFGQFSGDLLVGNFGDGRINAFKQKSNGDWKYVGRLRTAGGPIGIDGLWALEFGNGGGAGPTNSLYFTAGPDDETHGLFGSITAG